MAAYTYMAIYEQSMTCHLHGSYKVGYLAVESVSDERMDGFQLHTVNVNGWSDIHEPL